MSVRYTVDQNYMKNPEQSMVKEVPKSEVLKLRILRSTKEQIKKFAKQEGRFFEKQCQIILDESAGNHEKSL